MFSSWLWQTSWLCYEVNKHKLSRFPFFQCKYVVKHQNMIVLQTGTLYQNKLETNMRSSCKQLNLGKVKEKKINVLQWPTKNVKIKIRDIVHK